MRNFMISVLCLGILTGAWFCFDLYSDRTLQGYMETVDEQIITAIQEKNWELAGNEMDALSKNWHQYKKYAAFFLDTQTVNEADFSIARTRYYIEAKDLSNSTGELACLKEQLKFLHSNEELTFGNLF